MREARPTVGDRIWLKPPVSNYDGNLTRDVNVGSARPLNYRISSLRDTSLRGDCSKQSVRHRKVLVLS
jgi:hypothetical protein